METYSLIQSELVAVIDRVALEEASVVAPSVGKADCARIARELFGVIVSGIPLEDARAFRAALLAKNFATEIVADRDLPRLPDGRFFTKIDTGADGDTFACGDALGRREVVAADDVLLLAGGFLQRLRSRSTPRDMHVPYDRHNVAFDEDGEPALEYRSKLIMAREFRFEIFTKRPPYRLRCVLATDGLLAWNGVLLRVEKPDAIRAFMLTWRRLAPRPHRNLGLTVSDENFSYPSPRAFENEIRWRFHQLKQQAARR